MIAQITKILDVSRTLSLIYSILWDLFWHN